ncbi:NOL1/NOP2/sun family putative RNA methylase [Halarchaeum rubridurum]|uniref:NOL1/NOP2/sun family putative RNA methylase n=1 Tax=Halarchaeum rubridurum TaxID=489911 RepID=A0A830G1Z7_9EURY|nr:RsmB/NOP family class I SAM-dependent RNA methyltransferase [Halarchaeum rubridurum]MBP1955349.1 NOL1/NOP2/sun family putative RNA methylase [Halarchaeum rubridurum]GGM71696.1 SAM-dependent methyltransferase [Halarchaeum rubridurum]
MDALERYEPIIDDYAAFREACERPLPTVVRANGIKADPDRAVAALAAEGVGVTRRAWNPAVLEVDTDKPGNTWPYFHGWIHGQEEVSAIPARVLDPSPGDAVWDTCAAPGSKTTQLADLLDDTGLLVANDDNLGRLSALRSNAERLGATCVAVTNEDARRFTTEGFGIDAFDAVLADVPCTCEGTIRKNADALDTVGREASLNIAALQTDILRRAIRLTREGGTVVYSTCTFAPEENEGVLDRVLDDEPVELVDFDVGLDADPGLTAWADETYDDSLTKAKRFYPHRNDTGGFFCAKLEVGA